MLCLYLCFCSFSESFVPGKTFLTLPPILFLTFKPKLDTLSKFKYDTLEKRNYLNLIKIQNHWDLLNFQRNSHLHYSAVCLHQLTLTNVCSSVQVSGPCPRFWILHVVQLQIRVNLAEFLSVKHGYVTQECYGTRTQTSKTCDNQ